MKTTIRGVIFDMDGVLIDAREWHYEALNKALAVFGYQISRYEHLTSYDGLPTREKLRRLTVEKGLPEPLHKLIAKLKQRYTEDIIAVQCRPRFEKEYMISRLRSRGLKLGVASNAVRDSVVSMLSKSNILDAFDFHLSNQDVEKQKPDPEIYLKAADQMGFDPHQLVVVEDNHYGVEAAKTSGCHVIQVSGVEDVNLELIENFLASV